MRRYPWQLLQRLGSHIDSCRPAETHEDLDRVLAIIAYSRPARLDLRKLRCAQVMSFCVRGAHRAGAPSNVLFTEHLRVLDRLVKSRSWPAVRRLLHRYADETIACIRPERSSDLQRFLVQMRRDMRESLDTPRTLRDYARDVGVSVPHLSRSFSAAAGLSFREEARRIRVEEATRLLVETQLKISVIARRVGLKDPSHFVADFRRETGATPGEYRKTHRSYPSQHELSP